MVCVIVKLFDSDVVQFNMQHILMTTEFVINVNVNCMSDLIYSVYQHRMRHKVQAFKINDLYPVLFILLAWNILNLDVCSRENKYSQSVCSRENIQKLKWTEWMFSKIVFYDIEMCFILMLINSHKLRELLK